MLYPFSNTFNSINKGQNGNTL